MREFKVINEFRFNGQLIITLSSKRTVAEMGTKKIVCGDKEYSYGLTHNDYMFYLNTKDSLLEKNITFV